MLKQIHVTIIINVKYQVEELLSNSSKVLRVATWIKGISKTANTA